MLKSTGKLVKGLFVLLGICMVNHAMAEVIHSERSLYRNILVEDKGDLRCLKFNVKSTKTRQSCFLKSQPQQLVFNYTKQLLTGLFCLLYTSPSPRD